MVWILRSISISTIAVPWRELHLCLRRREFCRFLPSSVDSQFAPSNFFLGGSGGPQTYRSTISGGSENLPFYPGCILPCPNFVTMAFHLEVPSCVPFVQVFIFIPFCLFVPLHFPVNFFGDFLKLLLLSVAYKWHKRNKHVRNTSLEKEGNERLPPTSCE